MAAKPPENRCAVAGCVKLVMAGQLVCAEHKPPPLTLKQRIEKGPRFVVTASYCIACLSPDDSNYADRDTGLCRPCWRAWRWSSIREYEQPK